MRISDWSSDVCSSDLELFERIKTEIPGFDPKELAWDFDKEKQAMESLSADETAKWVRYHLPREEQWFKVAEHILENDKPDLMAVMFDGTDKIQHQAWPWLDKNLLPKNPQGHDKEMREVRLEYFNKLDGYIEIGRAHVSTTVTNQQLVRRLLLEKKKK